MFKRTLRLAVVLPFLIACASGRAVVQDKPVYPAEQLSSWNFDWDDNIAYMPTRVYVYHKTTGEERWVSTADFAEVRHMIGKVEPWVDYGFRDDDRTGSFREFRDLDGQNRFLFDIRRMLKQKKPSEWQAPAFPYFQQALERPETAAWVAVITARGHESSAMKEGLEYLKKKKLIANLPPQDSLYAVANPLYRGSAASPSAAKVKVMETILKRLQDTDLPEGAMPVRSADGRAQTPLHLWYFSDDDYGNYTTAVTSLSAGVKAGNWPKVKIVILYTGCKHPGVQPHSVVLTPDGGTRPTAEGELGESQALWRRQAQPLKRAVGN